MSRKWIHSIAFVMLMTVLAGCGQTVEEQVSTGIVNAQTTFEEAPPKTNNKVGNISLYIPHGFTIEQGETESNYLVSEGKNSYILFVNPNEETSSQLNYDLLMADTTKEVIKEETFKQDGTFGFSAVILHSEEQYETIVSIGGVKMTTVSNGKKLDDKMATMMEMVRSIQFIK